MGLVSAVGVGLSLLANRSARRSQKSLLRRQRRVAKANAKVVRLQGEEDARRFRIFADKRLGTGRAAVGASGIQLSGSALDSLEESARNLELDALSIEFEAELRAFNLEEAAQDFDLRRKDISRAAPYQDASTILSGYSDFLDAQPTDDG